MDMKFYKNYLYLQMIYYTFDISTILPENFYKMINSSV